MSLVVDGAIPGINLLQHWLSEPVEGVTNVSLIAWVRSQVKRGCWGRWPGASALGGGVHRQAEENCENAVESMDSKARCLLSVLGLCFVGVWERAGYLMSSSPLSPFFPSYEHENNSSPSSHLMELVWSFGCDASCVVSTHETVVMLMMGMCYKQLSGHHRLLSPYLIP